MASVDCADLPNPTTTLAFLPPDMAHQLEVSRYIYVASLGAFAWDLFSNVPADYKLLFKHRIAPATVVYFVSRIMSLAFIVSSTVFQIGSVGNCQALQIALGVCFVIAVPATSLLFLFRIRAVFHNQQAIVWLFAFLWIAVLAGCITVPFAINGDHIGPTRNCINVNVKPFSSVGIVISAVNDTLVLVAISLRLVYNSSGHGHGRRRVEMSNFWNGGALPKISKAVLQSGQQYYLITVGWNILAMVMILAPSVPPVYRAMFTIPSMAVENCMACKVYRDVRFGIIQAVGNSAGQHSSSGEGSRANYHPRLGMRGAAKPSPSVNEGIIVSTRVSTTADPPVELQVNFNDSTRGRASSSYDRTGEAKFGALDV